VPQRGVRRIRSAVIVRVALSGRSTMEYKAYCYLFKYVLLAAIEKRVDRRLV
jgi:hypothetical protein